jgi:hypothetical protein
MTTDYGNNNLNESKKKWKDYEGSRLGDVMV